MTTTPTTIVIAILILGIAVFYFCLLLMNFRRGKVDVRTSSLGPILREKNPITFYIVSLVQIVLILALILVLVLFLVR